ncbi:hypothetical protein Tco_1122336 [Tanacetum coccineum]|uniref:Uncharacterized protein n=1 Tax=Tanacetum coccineum TaxID=301880 RepID=A0ABQ5J085_9ASTR
MTYPKCWQAYYSFSGGGWVDELVEEVVLTRGRSGVKGNGGFEGPSWPRRGSGTEVNDGVDGKVAKAKRSGDMVGIKTVIHDNDNISG